MVINPSPFMLADEICSEIIIIKKFMSNKTPIEMCSSLVLISYLILYKWAETS